MTPRLIIVPGFGATPESHWFPWLASEAARRGTIATTVELPNPLTPDRAAWESAVIQAIGRPDPSTWLVAHSLGCVTSLRALASISGEWSLGGIVLVAGFSGRLASLPQLDDYLAEPAPSEHVARSIERRVVFSSDDDPVVPPRSTAELAAELDVDLTVLPGRGHFTVETGVSRVPELIDVCFAH